MKSDIQNKIGSSMESRLGTLEGEVEQVVAILNRYVQSNEETQKTLFSKIDNLTDKVSEKTTPNLQNLLMVSAAWATVVLMIIFGIGTPIIYGMNEGNTRDRADNRRAFEDLDVKLQREFALTLASTEKGITGLDNISKERHDTVVKLFDVQEKKIEEIQLNGTPAMRERMARLESIQEADSKVLSEMPSVRERIAKLEAERTGK